MSIRTFATSLVSLIALCLASVQAAPTTWDIDASHSGVGFKIRHFVTKVPGSFSDFKGTIVFDDEDVSNMKAEATIKVASVNTNSKGRDDHLQRGDYFNAEQHPEITFTSTKWEKTGENTYKMTGDLTMLGVTKPVTLDVTFVGTAEGRGGKKLAGFEGKGTIDRTEWGLTSGQPAVGKDVDIEISIEAALRQ